jgi:hypothetical protein
MATETKNGATKTFTATIGPMNERGLQIVERPGVWLNFSKFGPPPVVPPLGTPVRITIDARGFIRAIAPLEGAAPPPEQLPLAAPPAARSTMTDITRLAVLKAAARFQASKPDATAADVVATADVFLAWVTERD